MAVSSGYGRPDYPGRRCRFQALAQASGEVDGWLITRPANVRWLTGLDSSNAAVLLTGDRVVLATDSRYRQQAAQTGPEVELLIERDVAAALLGWAQEAGLRRLAFESDDVSVGMAARWQEQVSLELRGLDSPVQTLREIKEVVEIDLLRRCGQIASEALQSVESTVEVGMTEIVVARRLELAMGQRGADDRAFETIVASGPNSAIPHHRPSQRAIEAGDLLTIDFGAKVDGYRSDCTRTYIVGADPQHWQWEVFDAVERAAAAGRAALRAGAAYADVDRAARAVVEAGGFGENFIHGLGHGVGLEIHEAPLLAARSVGRLALGVVVTVEPGIYLPGRGGVRIEDTCLVTEDGALELTSVPREFRRLG
ncbi:MAG: aminopeptidase P family protein [Actinomycetes bacterium]